MSPATPPTCRLVFRTPTFIKSLRRVKLSARTADEIVRFVAFNAGAGAIEHRQQGFVLRRLPWTDSLWVQYLEDSRDGNLYLIAMTDEEMGPKPPGKPGRLARAFDRLWMAGLVGGFEFLVDFVQRFTGRTPRSVELRQLFDPSECDDVEVSDFHRNRPSKLSSLAIDELLQVLLLNSAKQPADASKTWIDVIASRSISSINTVLSDQGSEAMNTVLPIPKICSPLIPLLDPRPAKDDTTERYELLPISSAPERKI